MLWALGGRRGSKLRRAGFESLTECHIAGKILKELSGSVDSRQTANVSVQGSGFLGLRHQPAFNFGRVSRKSLGSGSGLENRGFT